MVHNSYCCGRYCIHPAATISFTCCIEHVFGKIFIKTYVLLFNEKIWLLLSGKTCNDYDVEGMFSINQAKSRFWSKFPSKLQYLTNLARNGANKVYKHTNIIYCINIFKINSACRIVFLNIYSTNKATEC